MECIDPPPCLVNVDVVFLDFCLVGELSPAFLTLIVTAVPLGLTGTAGNATGLDDV